MAREINLPETRIPWRQLTSLDVRVLPGVIPARTILADCTQLTTCNLSNFAEEDVGVPILPLYTRTRNNLSPRTLAPSSDNVDRAAPFFQPFSFFSSRAMLSPSRRLPRIARQNVEGFDGDDRLAFLRMVPTLTLLSLALPLLASLKLEGGVRIVAGNLIAAMAEFSWRTAAGEHPHFPCLKRIRVSFSMCFPKAVDDRLRKLSVTGFLED
ncbi:hypothetical protein DFH09DRAFT_1312630 [Mycena vulgaris]|nr:hypothetical protein DFH09DRAFT_1312630 [Mycena vulgaris]